MSKAGEKGRRGEEMALCYLMEKGYTLLERCYRAPGGEIDLIVQQEDVTIFVEVKYRPASMLGSGLMAVTPGKQRHIIKAAGEYLRTHGGFSQAIRFDAVEITNQGILHIENAFSGEWE